jgi:iron complex transport system ATP-binding protein
MPAPTTPAIELRNISVVLGGRTIVHDVTWSVQSGTCAAILGPNCCGKSTLLRLIAGYQYPTRGGARVVGETFGETNMNVLRRRIRLVQPPSNYDLDGDLTVHEAVITGFFGTRGLFDSSTTKMNARATVVLDQLGLSHLAERRYDTLSTGERTRALIARAIVDVEGQRSTPAALLLLLDEPTTGLDLPSRESVLGTIEMLLRSAAAPTILLTTHHVEELPASIANVLLLDQGKVAASGAPRDVLTGERLSSVYRTAVDVHVDGGRYYLHLRR